MEEQETPLEEVHEHIHHHAEHAKESWIMGVALSTALIAAIAAIASLLSGDNVNEAMMEQIVASDHWAHFQSKSIKAVELTTRIELLDAVGKPASDKEREKLKEYSSDQEEISNKAKEAGESAHKHMGRHHIIAKSVTWSQIAIARGDRRAHPAKVVLVHRACVRTGRAGVSYLGSCAVTPVHHQTPPRLAATQTCDYVNFMARRAFCIALLLFQTLWLNVIVPGHTRGMVALPGSECDSCAQPARPCCAQEHTDASHPKPVRDPASRCSICYFAARVSLPPVIDFIPPRLGMVEVLDPPAPQSASSIPVARTLRDRAPPLFA